MEKNTEYFCRNCGTKLKCEIKSPADLDVMNDSSGGIYWTTLGSRFDENTGKKQVALYYYCPNQKKEKSWLGFLYDNGCDYFVYYKGSKDYGVRLK